MKYSLADQNLNPIIFLFCCGSLLFFGLLNLGFELVTASTDYPLEKLRAHLRKLRLQAVGNADKAKENQPQSENTKL